MVSMLDKLLMAGKNESFTQSKLWKKRNDSTWLLQYVSVWHFKYRSFILIPSHLFPVIWNLTLLFQTCSIWRVFTVVFKYCGQHMKSHICHMEFIWQSLILIIRIDHHNYCATSIFFVSKNACYHSQSTNLDSLI